MEVEVRFVQGLCINCDGSEVTPKSPLYCSEQCKQAARLVRYVRACRKDGRDADPDVQEAIRMQLAMVLGAGIPSAHGDCQMPRGGPYFKPPTDTARAVAARWISTEPRMIQVLRPPSNTLPAARAIHRT